MNGQHADAVLPFTVGIMNRNERRAQQRAIRSTPLPTDPERVQASADAPRDTAEPSTREYYREEGGES